MSEEVKEDINFEEMETEQLEKFITSGGQTVEVASDETPKEEEKEEEKEEVVSEKEEEESSEESEESEEPEVNQEEVSETNNFYKGKERDDLIKIIEDQNRHISRQGNELGDFRKVVKEVEELKSTVNSKPKAEEEDAFLAQYDKNDVEAIEKLISNKIESREANKRDFIEKQLKYNKEQNEKTFEKLQQESDLFVKLEPFLENKFESSGKTQEERIRNTLEIDPNWVQNTVLEVFKNNFSLNTPKVNSKDNNDVVRKKKSAGSINNSKSGNLNTRKFKEEPSDPNEYLEYMKERGVNVPIF
tara:strand:- start:465 stop:1370 length:906 start_codon:yes stop_codon:yes gene_type:complete